MKTGKEFRYMRLFLITLLLMKMTVSAQQNGPVSVRSNSQFGIDLSNIPYQKSTELTFVDGSPFYQSDWSKGYAITNSGERTKPFVGRLNLLDNNLHYLNNSGEELVVASGVVEVTLVDTVKGASSTFFLLKDFERTGHTLRWYQKLDTGYATLYKLQRKRHVEEKPYNATVSEHRVITTDVYYLKRSDTVITVKTGKDFLEAFLDKSSQMVDVLSGISAKKLPSEAKMIEVVKRYNSLFAVR